MLFICFLIILDILYINIFPYQKNIKYPKLNQKITKNSMFYFFDKISLPINFNQYQKIYKLTAKLSQQLNIYY